jgi:hypothetical protein
MSPKWKHVIPELMTPEERKRHDEKERRGPHIKSRTPKQVRLKSRKVGTSDDIPGTLKAVHHGKSKGYRGNHTATHRSICKECGDPITFTTNHHGQLVAMDIMCHKPHRHQQPRSNEEENRRRVEAMREADHE